MKVIDFKLTREISWTTYGKDSPRRRGITLTGTMRRVCSESSPQILFQSKIFWMGDQPRNKFLLLIFNARLWVEKMKILKRFSSLEKSLKGCLIQI